MGLIRRKADWTHQDFIDYWRNTHGPLAAQAPGLRGYWQNAVTERLQRGVEFQRGPWDFDGFSQLWLAGAGQADHAFKNSDFAARLIADEKHFLGLLHIVTVTQSVVITVPEASKRGNALKRLSILKRRPDISADEFRSEWTAHADLVRRMPGVLGYRQNVVIARERTKGEPCSYDDLPIDGLVELWFNGPHALEAAFTSAAGQAATRHAKTFLAEITAFLVTEHQVV